MPTRSKRTAVSCSLPPDLAARLHAESDARLVAPSYLVEKGLRLLFTSFDRPMDSDTDTPKAHHGKDEIQG